MSTLIFTLALVAADPEPAIAVLALKPASSSVIDDAKLESAALVDAVRAVHGSAKVLSLDDVKSLLDLKAAQQLMGCDDPKCALDVSNALAADLIVEGTAGTLGGEHHVFVTILDGKKGRVVGRASQSWNGGDLKGAMKHVAAVAFGNDGAENGDQLLTDLRTAVVLDELDGATGKPMPLSRVAACVQGELVKHGVPVVSAEQVKRIRAQLDPTAPLGTQSAAVDALDASSVDVILSGSVRYAEAGKYYTNTAERASLTFELVKVDTGEVLASTSMSAIDRAPSVDGAVDQAANKVCAEVQPELAKALDLKIERGTRVVVDDKTATSPDAAARVAHALEAMKPLVARAKVKKVDAKGATLDVTVRGGDGVALALALDKAGQGARVASASAGQLSLKD